MTNVEVVEKWITYFNLGNIDELCNLYSDKAVNDQVVFDKPLFGKKEIRKMFEIEFERAELVCKKEFIHSAGNWIILEWSDPMGLRGCGFFKIADGKIIHQRGYFDQLSFFKSQRLPIPNQYLDLSK